MLTQVLDHLKNSLDDVRCIGPILDLEKFISREIYDEATPQYRLYTDEGETPITGLDDLKSLLTEENVTIESFVGRNSSTSHTLSPVLVTMTNVELKLKLHSDQDTEIIALFGRKAKRLSFALGYCNDNDTNLPLKLLNVFLGS